MKDKMVVKITAENVYKRRVMLRIVTIATVILLLFILLIYSVLYVVNQTGNFTINLDPNLHKTDNILMSPHKDFRTTAVILEADALEYMDNITQSWLPDYIDKKEGEYSKDNYIAYTFFIKNAGKKTIDYMATIKVIAVIKGVDEAVRVAVYHNGEKTVYAKNKKGTKQPEKNTTAFVSNTKIMETIIKDFKPKEVEKYTIVIWLEGNDPECIDNILGGEMKMEMIIKKYEKNK